MPLLLTLLAEEAPATLVLPNWAFPAIAGAFFLVVALVTWSYRDVANRHSDKTGGASGHSAAGQDAGHGHH